MPEPSEVLSSALDEMRALTPTQRKQVFAALKRERVAREGQLREELQQLPNSHWSKVHLLARLPNPTAEAYEQKIHIPEFTFMGVHSQPDFGQVLITFYPGKWTIELKSLKIYKEAFRNDVASYERIANVMYDDLMEAYEPIRLRLMMQMRPRGGIASALTIDSDWIIRGGEEHFRDWKHNVDAFGFELGSAVSHV